MVIATYISGLAILLGVVLAVLWRQGRFTSWLAFMGGLSGLVISGLPWSLARQQSAVLEGVLWIDGLSVLLLVALLVQLLFLGSTQWSPGIATAAMGAALVAMTSNFLWTALFVLATGASHVLNGRTTKGSWTSYLWLGLATVTLSGGVGLYLLGHSGSFDQVSAEAVKPEVWMLIFGACWLLLGMWPASNLMQCLDCPSQGILRLAVAGLLLRTFNLGSWPPMLPLVATVAGVASALLGALMRRERLTQLLPGSYLLAMLPLGGPLGPAAAVSCELLYPLWLRKPRSLAVGGLVLDVAWSLAALVPLWIVTVTAHQAGLSAAGVALLVAGILAMRSVPERNFQTSDVFYLLVPVTFPLAWLYLVAPAIDALYQGLGPMFVTADPWVGMFYPSGDWVLTVLPFPALIATVPALLTIFAVVMAIVPWAELRR